MRNFANQFSTIFGDRKQVNDACGFQEEAKEGKKPAFFMVSLHVDNKYSFSRVCERSMTRGIFVLKYTTYCSSLYRKNICVGISFVPR